MEGSVHLEGRSGIYITEKGENKRFRVHDVSAQLLTLHDKLREFALNSLVVQTCDECISNVAA